MEQTLSDKLYDLAAEIEIDYPDIDFEEVVREIKDIADEIVEVEDKAWKYDDLLY